MSDITFKDWQKLDLKIVEILEVEEIKGADRLFKLKVDLGTETRIIIAGLKKFYTKEELEGKRCILLANLETKNIKGIESKGMILAAVNEDKSEVKLIQPDGAIEIGSKIN